MEKNGLYNKNGKKSEKYNFYYIPYRYGKNVYTGIVFCSVWNVSQFCLCLFVHKKREIKYCIEMNIPPFKFQRIFISAFAAALCILNIHTNGVLINGFN